MKEAFFFFKCLRFPYYKKHILVEGFSFIILIITVWFLVTWCKDNVPIGEDSSVYQFIQVGNKYKMKVLRASHDDIGQYVIEARDSNGVQVMAAFSVNLSILSE